MGSGHYAPLTEIDTPVARWLVEHQRTQSWFALKIGVSAQTASRIVRGEVMPHAATIREIIRVTNGAITANDLLLAKTANTPANRAARIRRGKELIARGRSIVNAANREA